jgi:hypothetical protein
VFLPSRPIRLFVHVLPYPLNLVVLLIAVVVPAWIWWQSTRDDPVARGEPYGQVVPDPWHAPSAGPQPVSRDADQGGRPELGGGRAGPSA